jgi:hypothetical protein
MSSRFRHLNTELEIRKFLKQLLFWNHLQRRLKLYECQARLKTRVKNVTQ